MGLTDIFRKIRKRFIENKPSIATKKLLYDFFTREKIENLGNLNSDITIYIIRGYDYTSPFCIAPVHNLLANYFYVISHIFYAYEKGWIPVVDQLNFPEYNSMDFPINGTRNAWEYYWNQPSYVSLEDAYKSKRVVFSRRNFMSQWDLGYSPENYYNSDLLNAYHNVCNSFSTNDFTLNYINQHKSIFPSVGKVLGVNVRIGGHSLKSLNYADGHPVQPEIAELIRIVKLRMLDWNLDYVFIASDNDYSIQAFRAAFHDRLLVFERMRTEFGKEYEMDKEKEMYKKENLFQTSLDYLTEMYLLSCCDALIGSITSGFRFAIVQGFGKYEHLEIITNEDLYERKRE